MVGGADLWREAGYVVPTGQLVASAGSVEGLPRGGVMERADSFKQMSAIVVLNSVELLGDLMHFPGKLTLSSGEALFLTHLYCRKKVIVKQRTASSRSVVVYPIDACRRRRSCIIMIPEIGDDTVRAFRTMNQTPRRNRPPKEQVNFTQRSTSETDDSSDLQESLSRFNPENHMKYSVHGKQKAISLPSPPQCFGNQASLRDKASTISASPDMMSIFNKVLGTSKILKKPLLPFQEWNIDFSEITIGARVGIGFFGEVFCGTWNGLEVGIKVFLEQELTVENVEDFFNEISILSRIRHPNGNVFLQTFLKIVIYFIT
ncbi:Probable serine/threonine-protein kinase drkD [Olea europaea subsp. europaea]|uniref:Probable serine/threonine-protein kinase drkD n=1 Tax=Olea europaea subsp. europaea TaxID=158383 RepID=A0A8S0PCG0_OLEEU|nr:Probable serine/threonine-protein kinase drkD [Olea europaea subsp. europaea]